MSDAALWTALADPHRRAIVGLLLERPRPVGEIVEACGLSQPSTSKHLRVLRDAGLVRVRQDAQRRVYALDPAPIAELDAWLAPYRTLWNRSLDRLGGASTGRRTTWTTPLRPATPAAPTSSRNPPRRTDPPCPSISPARI